MPNSLSEEGLYSFIQIRHHYFLENLEYLSALSWSVLLALGLFNEFI